MEISDSDFDGENVTHSVTNFTGASSKNLNQFNSQSILTNKASFHLADTSSTSYIPTSSVKIYYHPNYEVTTSRLGNPMLLVYPINDKSKYFKYYFDNKYQKYRCQSCRKLGKTITAQTKTDSRGDEYVEMGAVDHVCKPHIRDEKRLQAANDLSLFDESNENV